jgi:toxin ParE1/3/4
VARVRISSEAERDIDGIAWYTMNTWGWRQAELYLARLEECFDLSGNNPAIGRNCDGIRAALRRFEIGSHVVFYLVETGGFLSCECCINKCCRPKTFELPSGARKPRARVV